MAPHTVFLLPLSHGEFKWALLAKIGLFRELGQAITKKWAGWSGQGSPFQPELRDPSNVVVLVEAMESW